MSLAVEPVTPSEEEQSNESIPMSQQIAQIDQTEGMTYHQNFSPSALQGLSAQEQAFYNSTQFAESCCKYISSAFNVLKEGIKESDQELKRSETSG